MVLISAKGVDQSWDGGGKRRKRGGAPHGRLFGRSNQEQTSVGGSLAEREPENLTKKKRSKAVP